MSTTMVREDRRRDKEHDRRSPDFGSSSGGISKSSSKRHKGYGKPRDRHALSEQKDQDNVMIRRDHGARPTTDKALSGMRSMKSYIRPKLSRADELIEHAIRVVKLPGAPRAFLGILHHLLRLYARRMPAHVAALGSRKHTNIDMAKLIALVGDFRSMAYLGSLPGIYRAVKAQYGARKSPDKDKVGYQIGWMSLAVDFGDLISTVTAHLSSREIYNKHAPGLLRTARASKLWRYNGWFFIALLVMDLLRMGRESVMDKRKKDALARQGQVMDRAAIQERENEFVARHKKRRKQHIINALWTPVAVGMTFKKNPIRPELMSLFAILAQVNKVHRYWGRTRLREGSL